MPIKHVVLSWDAQRQRRLSPKDSIGPLLSRVTHESKIYAYNSADWEIEFTAQLKGTDLTQLGSSKVVIKAHETVEFPFSYHATEETEDDPSSVKLSVQERYLR